MSGKARASLYSIHFSPLDCHRCESNDIHTAEDALLEVEALESIYPAEFEMVTQSPLAYKVHLQPNPGAPPADNHGAFAVCLLRCVMLRW